MLKYTLILLLTTIITSCNWQEKGKIPTSDNINPKKEREAPTQIGEYVVGNFEDAKGNLWFGTLEKA